MEEHRSTVCVRESRRPPVIRLTFGRQQNLRSQNAALVFKIQDIDDDSGARRVRYRQLCRRDNVDDACGSVHSVSAAACASRCRELTTETTGIGSWYDSDQYWHLRRKET